MSDVIHGVIHGKTIELERDLGLADGQVVEVVVRAAAPTQAWGEGIRRSAGALAAYPELDEHLEEIQQDRKLERNSEFDP